MNLQMRTRSGLASIAGGTKWVTAVAAIGCLALTVVALAQSGGGFDLTWNTIDGGGVTSSGGGFELSGAIGQADATARSALSGGTFALTGGFWLELGSLCTSFAAPDFDMDCDVDQTDYDALESCASGPAIPHDTGCEGKDLDIDGDVDQSDFGLFQRCFSGENIAAEPACMN